MLEGDVGLADATKRPVMWLVPHFLALDVAGAAVQLNIARPGASIYQAQSDPAFDAAMRRGRLRFGNAKIFARDETARPLMRAIRDGAGFFTLPDMDFGERDAAFVPFFGVPAATLLAPSRMARALNMTVQPVIGEMLEGGQGFRVRFLPPLKDFPTGDAVADTLRGQIEYECVSEPTDRVGCPPDAACTRAQEVSPWSRLRVCPRHQSRPHATSGRSPSAARRCTSTL